MAILCQLTHSPDQSLTYLNVSHNRLTSLAGVGDKVRILDASHNQLVSMRELSRSASATVLWLAEALH